MSLELFKKGYAKELNGLSSARVNTLYKKYKNAERDAILEAIDISKASQTKDKQRRSESTTTPSSKKEKEESMLTSLPIEYKEECKIAGIPIGDFNNVFTKLRNKVAQSRNSAYSAEDRLKTLYSLTDELFLLNKIHGSKVNIIELLDQ